MRLEVVIAKGPGGEFAVKANDFSLSDGGAAAKMSDNAEYPYAADYVNALVAEGWQPVSPTGVSVNSSVCVFEGEGRYKIQWEKGRWQLVDSKAPMKLSRTSIVIILLLASAYIFTGLYRLFMGY